MRTDGNEAHRLATISMKSSIHHRLIVPVQARGNVGKSTTLGILAGWLEQHAVEWQGFDLDPDHRSFVRLFPERVTLAPLGDEPEGDLIKLLRGCSGVPVTVVDPRAHLRDIVIRGFELIRFSERFADAGGRVTALLFPADDLEVMTDLDQTVSRLGGSVDYVVIKNQSRAPRTRMFDGSELEAELQALDADVVEIPALLSVARNHLAGLEADLGRGVSHAEAVMNLELPLDSLVRMVIEDWIKGLFKKFDQIAGKLLPADLAAGLGAEQPLPAAEVAIRRGAKINRSNL
jgi:hypothetical protein